MDLYLVCYSSAHGADYQNRSQLFIIVNLCATVTVKSLKIVNKGFNGRGVPGIEGREPPQRLSDHKGRKSPYCRPKT